MLLCKFIWFSKNRYDFSRMKIDKSFIYVIYLHSYLLVNFFHLWYLIYLITNENERFVFRSGESMGLRLYMTVDSDKIT